MEIVSKRTYQFHEAAPLPLLEVPECKLEVEVLSQHE